jgi:serine/threonine protein phosphatase 1
MRKRALNLRSQPGEPPPSPTEGRVIYAIGDVHGRYELLKTLLTKILTDCQESAPGERPMVVFCGDYVDRGNQSAEVLEALIWLKQRADVEVHTLMGNHEQALKQFLDSPEETRGWLRFGGSATLTSYGVRVPQSDDDLPGLMAARDSLKERMPASHAQFLDELELMLVVGDYAFVHAGVRPGVPLAQQDEADLLWIRDEFLSAKGPFEKVIVHGHSWSGPAQVLKHRVGLDTGAYATGVLTAARLQDGAVRLLDTSGGIGAYAI